MVVLIISVIMINVQQPMADSFRICKEWRAGLAVEAFAVKVASLFTKALVMFVLATADLYRCILATRSTPKVVTKFAVLDRQILAAAYAACWYAGRRARWL